MYVSGFCVFKNFHRKRANLIRIVLICFMFACVGTLLNGVTVKCHANQIFSYYASKATHIEDPTFTNYTTVSKRNTILQFSCYRDVTKLQVFSQSSHGHCYNGERQSNFTKQLSAFPFLTLEVPQSKRNRTTSYAPDSLCDALQLHYIVEAS
jgi:hypothetical protein